MAEELKPRKHRKRTRNRGFVTGVVIAVVVIIAGIGAYAWHSTPSFCGTVCHDSMGEHLANYQGIDASQGAGLAHLHADEGVTCLDCHNAELDVQVAELQAELAGRTDNLGLAQRYYIDNETCLSCHGDSYEKLAESTAALGDYNPHAQPHGEMNCNECHKGHANQVDTCGECHDNGGQSMRA